MKSNFIALVLCIVSIGMISCQKDPVREATEEYIKSNSKYIFQTIMLGGMNPSVTIDSWNPIPVDTITLDEFYLYELRKRIKEANEFKRHTIYDDSVSIARYQRNYDQYSSLREIHKRNLEDALVRQKMHLNQYQHMVDNINEIKELRSMKDGNESIYYVYQFVEKVTYKNIISGEWNSKDVDSYSYVNLIQGKVIYVAEGEEIYSPQYEKLMSPYKEKEFIDEDELELI